MNIKTTNLRLNLDKPDHRKAYEILKSSSVSYTKIIVAALIAFAENEKNQKALLDGITEIIRNEIGSVLQNCNFVQTDSSTEMRNHDKVKQTEISENAIRRNAAEHIHEEMSITDDSEISESEETDDSIDMDFLEM